MKPLDPTVLTPGIRETVIWLRSRGFETTDSGDGRANVEAGMECALAFPHVVIQTSRHALVADVEALEWLLRDRGVDVEAPGPTLGEAVSIEATFEPVSGVALIMLYGLDDALLARVVPRG